MKLTDPFGLSPFTSWSVLGHGLLDVLGFIPVIGAIPDTVNALWYLAEGDHFSAAASFVSAVPGWGDVIGAVGKTAKGCSKVSKMVRYGSKIVGRIGNIALGSYQTGSIAVSLYDKHVVQGESWDWDSTVQLFSAGLFATTTVVSAKGLKGDVGEYRRVVGSESGRKTVLNNMGGSSSVKDLILNSDNAKKWGVLEDGTNQGVKHFTDYWDKYPERIPSLEQRLGVTSGELNNSLEGFNNFTNQAERVISEATMNGNVRNINGKSIYYIDGATNLKKGVVVIVRNGKIQSMMPSDIKSFNKLQ